MWPFDYFTQRRKRGEEQIFAVLKERGKLPGLEISKATGISLGTLYVYLERLEKRGILISEWGKEYPPERGYRRRRYYWIKP